MPARRRTRGESRDVLLSHEVHHTSVKLVQVGTGGVDRQTGEPLHIYFEVTAKLPKKAEVTRTFTDERNARVAYLVAQYGVVDFTTPLGDLEGRAWEEVKNMTALSKLPDHSPSAPIWDGPVGTFPLPHQSCPPTCPGRLWAGEEPAEARSETRISSGDSEADSPSKPGAAPTPQEPGQEALDEAPDDEARAA